MRMKFLELNLADKKVTVLIESLELISRYQRDAFKNRQYTNAKDWEKQLVKIDKELAELGEE